jgi:hypothetical protein
MVHFRTLFLSATIGLVPLALASCSGTEETSAQTGAAIDGDDYQLTPFGRLHRDCIVDVSDDEAVITNSDGDRVAADRRLPRRYNHCQHAAKDARGLNRTSGGSRTPNTNGWVESVDTTFTNSYGFSWFNKLSGAWSVPTAPTSYVGQAIFLFPSLEPAAGTAILQPVLQYGVSAAGGGQFWSIASWYLSSTGNAFHSGLLNVGGISSVTGSVVASNCATNGQCDWQVKTSYRLGLTTVSTTLNTTALESFRLAQKAVLEVTGITNSCSQYPATTTTTFSNIVLTMPGPGTTNFNDVTNIVPWQTHVTPGLMPSCGFAASSPSATTATLVY